jgi:hypothetical protein
MNPSMTLSKKGDKVLLAQVSLIDPDDGKTFILDVIIQGATEREVKTQLKVIKKGILESAGQNYAKEGDRIYITRVASGFEFDFRMSPKPWHSSTLGGDILKVCKWVESHTTYKSNDVFRLMMSSGRLTETFVKAVFAKMSDVLKGCCYTEVKNIAKPNRFHGNCYKNAWQEFKNTGNEPMVVMECCLMEGGYAIVVPHAINYNAKTGEYYDTTSDTSIRKCLRMSWIIKQGQPLLDWYEEWHEDWRKTEQFANTYGCYTLLWVDDNLITLHTKGIECDRTGEVKRLESVEEAPLIEWAEAEFEEEGE